MSEMPPGRVKIAVLLSGSGRTLENFLDRIADQSLPVRVAAVVSSRADVRGVEVARQANIPCEVFPRRSYDSIGQHNAAINDWLAAYQVQMIVLAGYLCFYIPPEGFTGPVVNIHPALLPKYGGKGFYGDRVHQAVLEAGDKESGCTVHLVNHKYDDGKILGQKTVPVLPGDTVSDLASRVFAAECELYPQILVELAKDINFGPDAGDSNSP